jgi:hypothetical protein
VTFRGGQVGVAFGEGGVGQNNCQSLTSKVDALIFAFYIIRYLLIQLALIKNKMERHPPKVRSGFQRGILEEKRLFSRRSPRSRLSRA